MPPAAHPGTAPGDRLLLYFTSGTTSKPKLVEHTQVSYPVGHLATMYWLGLQPGDVHLNISSPGWAKHAWSCFFAPWIAEATIFLYNYGRFDAGALLGQLREREVTSFCAPPTVWRMLITSDLSGGPGSLREVIGAGEPLNPEVIEQVKAAWGLTIRDGYGQTETSAQVGNTPGVPVKPGSMGKPLPGLPVVLVDPLTGTLVEGVGEGEMCLDLSAHPLPLMTGYQGDPERNDEAMAGGYYHTGDVASRDEDGYITYVGRTDDVFKASDYKISPFELESVLIEHPAVAEAAVVPAPDPVRLAVPKAYVALAPGYDPSDETALRDPEVRARAPGAVPAGAAGGVLRAAQDDLGQDPPRRAAGPRERPRRRHVAVRRRPARVARRGLPGAARQLTPAGSVSGSVSARLPRRRAAGPSPRRPAARAAPARSSARWWPGSTWCRTTCGPRPSGAATWTARAPGCGCPDPSCRARRGSSTSRPGGGTWSHWPPNSS